MALALENALALQNVSERRRRIRIKMRSKYGKNWRKNSKAVAEFTRLLKAAGIYLTPGRAAKWKKTKAGKSWAKTGRKTKSSAGRRSGSSKAKLRAVAKKAASLVKGGMSRKAAWKAAWAGKKGAAPKAPKAKGKGKAKAKKRSWKDLSFKQLLSGFGGKRRRAHAHAQVGAGAMLPWGQPVIGPIRAAANGIMLNGLALTNGLALMNRHSRRNPLSGMGIIGSAVVLTSGAATLYGIYDYLTPFMQEHIYSKSPIGSEFLSDTAPNTVTGAMVGLVAAPLALGTVTKLASMVPMLGSPVARGIALGAGGFIPVIGGVLVDLGVVDPAAIKDKLMSYISGSAAPEPADVAGLAMDVGALALENRGLAGLALENRSYGDGFFSETAPLGADIRSLGYHQASLADAYYSGQDFSVEEGQALLNGPAAFANRYGQATIRSKRNQGASHLAGKPGLRWAWLISMTGWSKARDIAAMKPQKRLELLKAMRAAALAEYSKQQAAQTASDAQVIAAAQGVLSDQAPSAGTIVGGATGASGASGPGDLGAALFTR